MLFVLLLIAIGLLACQLNSLAPAEVPTATATVTRAPSTAVPTRTPLVAQVVPTTTASSPPTPIPAPVIAQVTDNLRIRSAPSTSSAIVDRLNKGDKIQIVGRTAANDWLLVPLPSNPNGRGWISATYAQLNGPLDSVPIIPPGQRAYP